MAVPLIFSQPKRVHVLVSLHWLNISSQITFKALSLAFRTVTGTVPSYFSTLLQIYYIFRYHLQSVNECRLVVLSQQSTKSPSTNFIHFHPSSLLRLLLYCIATFKKQLKTHLFIKHFTFRNSQTIKSDLYK